MKKYNILLIIITIIYLALSIFVFIHNYSEEDKMKNEYRVEINRLYSRLNEDRLFNDVDLSDYKYIKTISFLGSNENNKKVIENFYKSNNDTNMEIRPLYENNKLVGYVRFDYKLKPTSINIMFISEVCLAILFLIVMSILLYVKVKIMKPFNELTNIPYELAKGNYKEEIEETSNKYFGKFIWGISMLRDNLNSSKNKSLKLEREKKVLLLSISHDIKIPLNSIKLYAKGIKEDIYEEESEKKYAANQISEKVKEIEKFVKEIMKNSSEEILEIEVINKEFYLKDLVDKVEGTYSEKCKVNMIDFNIGQYDNKLINGDLDRAFEVCGNIIENAFKYGDGMNIEISFYEEEYCQLIKIYNTGEIISSNEFNHIFDSFFRGSNVEGKDGQGLGLYICNNIMKKMDGDIFAECEERGMSFTIVLQQV